MTFATVTLIPCCREALAALLFSLKFGVPVTVRDNAAVFVMLAPAAATTI